MIKLADDTISMLDIDQLINWLQTYPKLTKGDLTIKFESDWSSFLNSKYSTFVNSGSSANLLMLYTLMESGKITKGDKVIVPAVSWATDLSPVIQLGLHPILCDCNMADLSVDIDHLLQLIKEEKPRVLLLVSVLGLIPEMDRILDICQENNLILLEDCCESLGSSYGEKKLGTFGLMSTFSTYFGHHMSTIEGGIVSTSDEEMNDLLKSMRNHGWDRDWNEGKKNTMKIKWNVNEFDALYTFYHPGFNFRSTDLQAFIGIEQLKKLPKYCNIRNINYQTYCKNLNVKEQSLGFVSNFAFPIISENRSKIVEELRNNQVECRPLICGSMGSQPMYTSRYGEKILKNANRLKNFGFYVPNHQNILSEDVDFICGIINKNL